MCGKDEDGKPMKISQIKVSEEIQNNDVSGCITEKLGEDAQQVQPMLWP